MADRRNKHGGIEGRAGQQLRLQRLAMEPPCVPLPVSLPLTPAHHAVAVASTAGFAAGTVAVSIGAMSAARLFRRNPEEPLQPLDHTCPRELNSMAFVTDNPAQRLPAKTGAHARARLNGGARIFCLLGAQNVEEC